MSDFGAGPFLTEVLDFEVTETGDIRSSTGSAELEKDIALQSIIRLSSFRGARQTVQTRARLRSRVRDILNSDPRISSVSSITINFIQGKETAQIITGVITDDSQQELVFNI